MRDDLAQHALGDGLAKPASHGLVILLRVAQAVLVASIALFSVIAILLLVPDGPLHSLFPQGEGEPMPPYGRIAFACFASAVTAAGWFLVLNMLAKIVRTVQAGDPFVEANIGRLRGMWILIAAIEVFRMVIYSAADIALNGTSVTPAETGIDIRIGTWFLVLVIAVLSEAFRQGAEMRREQELTI